MSNEIQRAAEGTCQYLVRNESGKLCECGGEAAWRGRKNGRLIYCDQHGRIVGKSFAVIATNAEADGRRAELKPWKEYQR